MPAFPGNFSEVSPHTESRSSNFDKSGEKGRRSPKNWFFLVVFAVSLSDLSAKCPTQRPGRQKTGKVAKKVGEAFQISPKIFGY